MAGECGLEMRSEDTTAAKSTLSNFLWDEDASVAWMLCLGWLGDSVDALHSGLFQEFIEEQANDTLSELFGISFDGDASDEEVVETLFEHQKFGWLASVEIAERLDWTEQGYSTCGMGFIWYLYVDHMEDLEPAIRMVVCEQVEKMRVKARR